VTTEHLDGIDIKDGLSHVGGKKKFLFDLLLKFAGNYETFGVDLTTRCGNNEWEEGNRMIHTMKGTSGNLGMVQLHALCVKLEEDLRANPSADVPMVMRPMLDELSKILNSIRNNIFLEVPKTTELLPDKIIPQLFSLEKLLSDHDPEAINLMNEIGIIKGLERQLERIREALATYDFESAMKTLKEFKSSIE
jgi:HPt (histidine-containing phosphotransfer) domain-containing protein